MSICKQYYGFRLCRNCGTVFLALDENGYRLFDKVKKNNGLFNVTEINEWSCKTEEDARARARIDHPNLYLFPHGDDNGWVYHNYFKYIFDDEYKITNVVFDRYKTDYEGKSYASYKATFKHKIRINKPYDNMIVVKVERLFHHIEKCSCPICNAEDSYNWEPWFDKGWRLYRDNDSVLKAFKNYSKIADYYEKYGSIYSSESEPELIELQKTIVAEDGAIEIISNYDIENYGINSEYNKTMDKVNKSISVFFNDCENAPFTSVKSVENIDEKNFVFSLLCVEKNISTLSKRLEALYYQKCVVENRMNRFNKRNKALNEIRLKQIKSEIKALSESPTKKKLKKKLIELYDLVEPERPAEFKEKEPAEPAYRTPNIFNKKKALAENERVKAEYEKAVLEYEKKLADYNDLLKKYESEKEKFTKLLKEKKADYIEKSHNKIEELKAEENAITSSTGDELVAKEQCLQVYNDEILECENLIKRFIETRKQLHSLNIVFPKYTDFVALSVIYEYLYVGRCSSLAGTDGAYNLYESELRQNIIISKLDKIIEELEQIKTNQFMTYQLMSEMNDNISSMNDKLSSVATSLISIDKNTKDIKQMSQFIAYNTEKTAYYAKANAELTNALGYMVAFK